MPGRSDAQASTENGTALSPIVLDENTMDTCTTTLAKTRGKGGGTSLETKPRKQHCKGILVCFPAQKNHHTSHPFGIHNEHNVPWDYHSVKDMFYIQAK